MKANKKHMNECISTHTMLHSLFGLGLGMMLAGLLHLNMWTNIVIGLVFVALSFLADVMTGIKSK